MSSISSKRQHPAIVAPPSRRAPSPRLKRLQLDAAAVLLDGESLPWRRFADRPVVVVEGDGRRGSTRSAVCTTGGRRCADNPTASRRDQRRRDHSGHARAFRMTAIAVPGDAGSARARPTGHPADVGRASVPRGRHRRRSVAKRRPHVVDDGRSGTPARPAGIAPDAIEDLHHRADDDVERRLPRAPRRAKARPRGVSPISTRAARQAPLAFERLPGPALDQQQRDRRRESRRRRATMGRSGIGFSPQISQILKSSNPQILKCSDPQILRFP